MAEDSPVQTFYEDYWACPDHAPPAKDPSRGVRLRLLEADLQQIQPAAVIDAGSGTGWTVQQLKRRSYNVVGLDISATAIQEALRQDPHGTYLQAVLDGARWPIESGQVDLVYSFEVIEHLIMVRNFFQECHRVLRPNGFIALTTPYHGLVKNVLLAAVGFDKHFSVEGGHIRFFSPRSLVSVLRNSGFKITHIKFYGRIRPVAQGMYVLAQKVD
jgi:2-polyprenyl-3-methyl-5-hydroxy-6-metoxy-1,4-benzoquinol methylase